MARSLSHLTGHELAALAAPFENPRRGMIRRSPRSVLSQEYLDYLKSPQARDRVRFLLDNIYSLERDILINYAMQYEFETGNRVEEIGDYSDRYCSEMANIFAHMAEKSDDIVLEEDDRALRESHMLLSRLIQQEKAAMAAKTRR